MEKKDKGSQTERRCQQRHTQDQNEGGRSSSQAIKLSHPTEQSMNDCKASTDLH
jgi:hypothetical protein